MMRINKLKLSIISLLITGVFLSGFYYLWLAPRYTVPILMYHSIGYGEGSLIVTPENFNRQMKYLKSKGYEVISLDELLKIIESKKRVKRNKVVITFDDGRRDNFTYAYPILKHYGFSATIFLITGLIRKNSKDNERGFFLSWDEIKEMSNYGVVFGSHTKTHLDLGLNTNEKIVLEELAGSKKVIEKEINKPADFFCYPSGLFNQVTKELVKKVGYNGACTTNRGYIKYNRDVYELKRIKVTNSDTNKPFSFWAKLSGYYILFKRTKAP